MSTFSNRSSAVIDVQDIGGRFQVRNFDVIQRMTLRRSASPMCLLAARIFDQNPPHRLGRSDEEVPTALPLLRLLAADQPQIGLMDQCGRLQCLAGRFQGQSSGGQSPQLFVDQR